jgi:hypothetical protein
MILGAHKPKKEQKQYQQQVRHYEERLADWQQERDDYAELIDMARDFRGQTEAEELVLKPGEALFLGTMGKGIYLVE